MKPTLPSLALTVALATCVAGILSAQTTNQLRIYTAIEVQYQTEIGKTYTLQGAVNLTNWTDIGNPVLGHGRDVDQVFSTKNAGTVSYAAYRLRIDDGPTNGYAPWSVAGVRVQMEDGSATNLVQYLSSTTGQDAYPAAADPFTYQYTRLTENDARVDRTFTPDRHESLTYSYTAPGLGTWLREEYRQGSLERRVLGVFRYLADGTNNLPGMTNPPVTITNTQPPMPPTNLVGIVYYVLSGALPDQLTFQTTNTGFEMSTASGRHDDSNGSNPFSYTYAVRSSNTASLNLTFGYYGFGGDRNEYDLTYTDGPSGTFVRRIFRLGSLYSTDTGAFSPNAPLPVQPAGTNNPPAVTNPPPASPVGLTYTIMGDSKPLRLVFQTTTMGLEFDDSSPSEFTYTYQTIGPKTFTLIVYSRSDKADQYDLALMDGAHGTFVHNEIKDDGTLERKESGIFTISVTAP